MATIEQNIERIATALESIAEQGRTLLTAIAYAEKEQEIKKDTADMPVGEIVAKSAGVAKKKTKSETAKATPVVPAEGPKHDQDSLRKLGKEVYSKKGSEVVYAVLRKHGAVNAKINELPADKYDIVAEEYIAILSK